MADMDAGSYRTTLPSERYARVKAIAVARKPAIDELIAVQPDKFEARGDNWVCENPSGGGRDPGWVSRVGTCFDNNPAQNAKALIELITSIPAQSDAKNMEGALELALAAVQGSRQAASELAAAAAQAQPDPLVHLANAFSSDSPRVHFGAMTLHAYILRRADAKYREKHLTQGISEISKALQAAAQWSASQKAGFSAIKLKAEAATKACSLYCEHPALREKIVSKDYGNIAVTLAKLLAATGDGCDFSVEMTTNIQFVYEATQSLWLLTFSPDVLVKLHSGCSERDAQPIIRMLNSLVRKQKRDKCVRMAILTLKNFTKHHQDYPPGASDANYVREMISVGMLTTLQILKKRAFGDEDIVADIDELYELLEQNAEDLSSYAQYKQEVLSGTLEWSPPHTSEKFWRENVRMFENDSWGPVMKLADIILMSSSTQLNDKQVSLNLQIACHDLGEFVRHHPQGRKVWEQKLAGRAQEGGLTLKDRVMALIAGEGEQGPQPISRQALLCMQKVLVRKWDHLDKA